MYNYAKKHRVIIPCNNQCINDNPKCFESGGEGGIIKRIKEIIKIPVHKAP